MTTVAETGLVFVCLFVFIKSSHTYSQHDTNKEKETPKQDSKAKKKTFQIYPALQFVGDR